MTLKEKLFIENSKSYWIQLSKEILEYGQLDELMNFFLSEDKRLSQRASAIIMTIADRSPDIFSPYLRQLVAHLGAQPTETQKRNIIRIIDFIDIPEDLEGEILNYTFLYLENLNESIAVRAFSMKVLGTLYKKYPEIKEELQALIEKNLQANPSPGIKNCGNKILKELKKEQ